MKLEDLNYKIIKTYYKLIIELIISFNNQFRMVFIGPGGNKQSKGTKQDSEMVPTHMDT